MYKTSTISIEKSNKIIYTNDLGEFKDGWEWICENNHGVCYWNSKTGELMWVSDNNNAKYSKLVKEKGKDKGQLYCFNLEYYLVRNETQKAFLNKTFDGRHGAREFGQKHHLEFTGDIDENVFDFDTSLTKDEIINNTKGLNAKELHEYLDPTLKFKRKNS